MHDSLVNRRFVGAWLLQSFESQAADGGVSRPWGDDPLGLIMWDAGGYFSVQLGPRGKPEAYVSFFGTWEAEDGESGLIVLKVTTGSAPDRVNGDQRRNFLFVEDGLLRMRPPTGPDGSQSTFMWRRTTRES